MKAALASPLPSSLAVTDARATALYVHVPFCASKCDYCAFYSRPPDGALVNRYVAALIAELKMAADSVSPRTIFFGGGTPSLLNLCQWEKILEALSDWNLSGVEEWTVECNPATVSLDKARLLKAGGVNRISMGVQSLNPELLRRLGRVHSREMVFKSYDILRRAGFDNVNLDLMFGIPGQTLDIWNATLAEIVAMSPEHLSCYEVIYEEDTALFEQLSAGEFAVDEELNGEMHERLISCAEESGFTQYEVANLARREAEDGAELPSRACKHNVNYWRGGGYYGAGPSASGFLGPVRYKNGSNTTRYCELIEQGKRPVEWTEELPPLARAGEIAAFGLRMNAGWPLRLFYRVTGYRLEDEWRAEMKELEELGFAEWSGERFRLTRQGLRMADWAAEKFIRTKTELASAAV